MGRFTRNDARSIIFNFVSPDVAETVETLYGTDSFWPLRLLSFSQQYFVFYSDRIWQEHVIQAFLPIQMYMPSIL